ncbi:MAG TPA: hypothetical protein VGS62_07110 [Streptosporangiaceae bacterium]|nr:hypothetical protein [Streptosporangiaceae bacterium]
MRRPHRTIAILTVFTVTACMSSTTTASSTPAGKHTMATRSPSPPPSTTKPPPPPPPPRVIMSSFRASDGTLVTLARFTGTVFFRLHAGSSDPGSAALSVVHAGPAVGPIERHRLLAAFNGGFLLAAGAGGYEQEGHVISPLRNGLMSLVIDRSGAARIGVWRVSVPQPHEAVFSVRQNLTPLVRFGRPAPAAADWGAWGATLGGGAYVARSALGMTPSGQLIFAGGMSTVPADLATALAHAGARIAMELDINPEWVQLDVARVPGGVLRAAIPGQERPPGQYLAGWTRDFITVLGP